MHAPRRGVSAERRYADAGGSRMHAEHRRWAGTAASHAARRGCTPQAGPQRIAVRARCDGPQDLASLLPLLPLTPLLLMTPLPPLLPSPLPSLPLPFPSLLRSPPPPAPPTRP
mmetsp:Transcript_19312/g.41706  ORF Transcript_19312/g.41706 Transcript_19312/m.41706 type:complete len:113 (+) Transcript_19312:734-1072(+)